MYWLFIFSYTIIVKGRSEPMISKKSELSELVRTRNNAAYGKWRFLFPI